MFHSFRQAGLCLAPTLRHAAAPIGPEQQIRTAERGDASSGTDVIKMNCELTPGTLRFGMYGREHGETR